MVVNAYKRFVAHVRHDIRVYIASLKVQFRAAATLRGAFAAQVFGMIFNNIALVVAWFFFFDHFGEINGWSMADFVAMQGVVMFVFGLTIFCSAGLLYLPRYVDTGAFDSFLTKPTSVLGQVGSSSIDITTLGDMALGIALMLWYAVHIGADPLSILMFIAAVLVAFIAFWTFAMFLPYILSFYIYDSERLGRNIGITFLDAMNYPSGVLVGKLRTILLIVLPSLLIGVVPVDALRGLHWEWVGLGAVVAVSWYVVSLWLFRRALRKYESANLVGAR